LGSNEPSAKLGPVVGVLWVIEVPFDNVRVVGGASAHVDAFLCRRFFEVADTHGVCLKNSRGRNTRKV
jgi:hypothetical protein